MPRGEPAQGEPAASSEVATTRASNPSTGDNPPFEDCLAAHDEALEGVSSSAQPETDAQRAPDAQGCANAPREVAVSHTAAPASASSTAEPTETPVQTRPPVLAAELISRFATGSAKPGPVGSSGSAGTTLPTPALSIPAGTLRAGEASAETAPGSLAELAAEPEPAGAIEVAANTTASAMAEVRAFTAALEGATPRTDAAPRDSAGAQAPTPAPAPHAPAPAESERAAEILRQMRVHFAPEMRSATIQLTPVELGRISIRLQLEDGELRAVVRAEKRETLEALARHVPELRATLEQQGIQARHFDLQLGFQQHGARQQGEQQAAAHARNANESQPAPRPEETRLSHALAAHAGGVDTYA